MSLPRGDPPVCEPHWPPTRLCMPIAKIVTPVAWFWLLWQRSCCRSDNLGYRPYLRHAVSFSRHRETLEQHSQSARAHRQVGKDRYDGTVLTEYTVWMDESPSGTSASSGTSGASGTGGPDPTPTPSGAGGTGSQEPIDEMPPTPK